MGLSEYKGSTRAEMERAGLALPKKEYRCVYCSGEFGHDEIHRHQEDKCPLRPGSTVKRSEDSHG